MVLLFSSSPFAAGIQFRTYPLGQETVVVCYHRTCPRFVQTMLALLTERTGWIASCSTNRSLLSGRGRLVVNNESVVDTVSSDGLKAVLRRIHRELRVYAKEGVVRIPRTIASTVPKARWSIRGHQIASSHHPSMFRTWPELKQFVTDLSIFGTNQIELAHVPLDPATGKLPVEDLLRLSELVHQVDGLNFSIWWSTEAIKGNLGALPGLFEKSPQLDSLFFPGGDGGTLEWPVIAKAATLLRQAKGHQDAGVWVSAQEVNASTLDSLVRLLRSPTNTSIRDAVLGPHGGVVFGPHNAVPLTRFVELFQAGTALHTRSHPTINVRQYPDICHAVDAGFAIPGWDAAWAMAYRRQVVNPLPRFFSHVIAERSNGSTPTRGVGAYSEGLNDDLNKVVWSALGEDASLTVEQAVQEYARYFFGPEAENDMTLALFGLEQNWAGPVHLAEAQVESTLMHLESAAATVNEGNWRMIMYLRRGLMDRYVQSAAAYDWSTKELVIKLLKRVETKENGGKTCMEIVQEAVRILSQNQSDPRRLLWRQRIDQLTAQLNDTVGAEVLQTQDIFLNLKSIDAPQRLETNFLLATLKNITTDCVLNIHTKILNWSDPGPGGFYDNIGSIVSADHPHLMQASSHPEYENNGGDPSCYFHALQGGIDVFANVRPSWLRYSMSFYDAPLTLKYDGLSPGTQYMLRIVYWFCFYDCEYDTVRMVANHGAYLVHDYRSAPNPMQALDFVLPKHQTSAGSLHLACTRYSGLGGNGKTCQVSEVWLVPVG